MTLEKNIDNEYLAMVFDENGTKIDQRVFTDEKELKAFQIQESMKGFDVQVSKRNLLVE